MIGKTIKIMRMLKGITQADLANEIEVSVNYISLIENDKREPSLSKVQDISKALDVPIGLFFLDMDLRQEKLSPREKNLILQIKDIVFQLELLKQENLDVE